MITLDFRKHVIDWKMTFHIFPNRELNDQEWSEMRSLPKAYRFQCGEQIDKDSFFWAYTKNSKNGMWVASKDKIKIAIKNSKTSRAKRREKANAYRRAKYQENPEPTIKRTSEYHKRNRDKSYKKQMEWKKKNPDKNNVSNSKFSIVLLLVFIIAISVVVYFQIRKVDNNNSKIDNKASNSVPELSYENRSLIVSDIQKQLKDNPPLTDKQRSMILKTLK